MKKMMFLFLFLAACTHNKFLYTDQTGSAIYQVTCNGAYLTMGDCLARMAEQCPTGFNILMSSEKQVGLTSDFNTTGTIDSNPYSTALAIGLGSRGQVVGQFSRYMIYSCKPL